MALDNRGFLVAVLLVATAAELVGNAAAATYVVGDNFGWSVPNNPSDYSNWTSQHVFREGDVLVFNFVTGQHDVAQVTKAAFDGCSSTNPIVLQTTGPWNTTVNSTGDYYYICTFGVHCSLGQKLAINVTASSAPAPSPIVPTPAPTPSASPSPSPGSPTPSPSPAPTPGSPTPSPGSTPAPSPGAGATPPPSPSPGTPSDGLTPPPPPSSATTSAIGAPLIGFALAVFGLMI